MRAARIASLHHTSDQSTTLEFGASSPAANREEVYRIVDIDWPGAPINSMRVLLVEFDEFITRHRACGRLTGDATDPAANGYLLTVACSCGVTFMRWVTPREALRDLVLSELLASAN